MKHSTVVLAASPVFSSFSPGKRAISRRLRITRWQTHSWIKKITEARQRSDPREGLKPDPCARRIPMQSEPNRKQRLYQPAASVRVETLVFATLGVVAMATVLIAMLTSLAILPS